MNVGTRTRLRDEFTRTTAPIGATSEMWERIEHRLAADPSPPELLEPPAGSERRPAWSRTALAGATAALVAISAVVATNTGDRADDPAAAPPETGVPAPPVVHDLPYAGTELVPGRYRSDVLGRSLAFDLPPALVGRWELARASERSIWLATDDVGSEFIGVARVGSWYSEDEGTQPGITGQGSIPAGDIATAFSAGDLVIIADPRPVAVAGRPATTATFMLAPAMGDPTICSELRRDTLRTPNTSGMCRWLFAPTQTLERRAKPRHTVGSDFRLHIWVIDLDGGEPVAILGSTHLIDDQSWAQLVLEPFVASLTIDG